MSVPARAGGRPSGPTQASTRVPDPLTPAEVIRRRRELQKTLRGISAGLQQVVTGGMLVLGVCLGALIGTVTGDSLAGYLTALVGALVLAVGEVWWQMGREARAARELRRLRDRWTITVPVGEAEELVTRIADDIAVLPAQLRADFAPLMATVRECTEALTHAPASDRYLVMLRERAERVRQVREEYAAVAALQRDQEAMERFAGDTTGQDLVIVTQIRDALAAVRAELGSAAIDGRDNVPDTPGQQ